MHWHWHWHCPIHIKFLLALICGVAGFAACAQNGVGQGAVAANLFQQALAYENGEGVARDQILAASLYCRAARRMLKVVGSPAAEVPECMREPTPPAAEPALPAVPLPRVDYRAIAPRKIFDLVMRLAPQFKVEPQLALAIIGAESNFNSLAVSVKSAQGLMQLIPQTSQRFNVKNAFDPAQNIRGGLTYLRWLLAYFEGDVALVATAYNAGEGTVERYRGVPPYLETPSSILLTFLLAPL